MKTYYSYEIKQINRILTIVAQDDYLIKISFEKKDYDFEFLESKAISSFKKELDEYFSGRLKIFKTGYKLTNLTDFQIKVLSEVSKVSYGEFITYSDIAKSIKNEKACRAVGNAVGKNPLPIIVPCHRIIRQDNKIGGYTGGRDIKIKLLDVENIKL